MIITEEQKSFIENIIKECPGYKGNEHLADVFFDEVVRKADAFISGKKELSDVKVYLKRTANIVILEITKAPSSSSDADDKTLYDKAFEEIHDKQFSLSEKQINIIKRTLNNIEENDKTGLCKDIFRLKYLNDSSNEEIAEKLGVNENEVNEKLIFILNNLRQKI